ncbi:MAG: tetratricopeptide repeat protein [Candidatus Aminicenantales bacterium]
MISRRHIILVSFLVFASVWTAFGQAGDDLARADQFLLSHRWDDAITNYLKIIASSDNKERRLAWDDLGYAYLKKREFSKALDYLEISAATFPEDFDVRFYIAVAFFLNNEIDKSAARLNDIARNIYFDGRWLENLADLKILNEFDEPVPRPELEGLRKEKGVFLQTKNAGVSVLYIDAFNEKNEGLFHYLRGLVLEGKGLKEEAREQFAAAAGAGYETAGQPVAKEKILRVIDHRLKSHPGSLAWLVHEQFLRKVRRSDIPSAIGILEDALHIDQKSFEINHNLALLQFDIGNLEQAESFCARALWWRENDAQCHELMGIVYFRRRAYEEALREFERAVQLDAGSASAHHNLGSAYYALKDASRAELNWKRAIKCEGQKGIIQPATSPPETAAGELRHSLKVTNRPVSFLSYTSLGRLYLEQKRLDAATDQFKRAMEIAPGDADIYLDMAKALLEKGLKEEAAVSLKKYFSLGGKNEGEALDLANKLKKMS